MEQYEHYYDFKIGEVNAGYFWIASRPNHIIMMAKFEWDDQRIENHYEVGHDGINIIKFRYSNNPWTNILDYPKGCFPTAAYPLLLEKAQPTFTYCAIYDSSGEVFEERQLVRQNHSIIESANGKMSRTFIIKDSIPVRINWGGPISTIKHNLRQATKGSPFDSSKYGN